MTNENHKNGRGIFYGVIGVATLVVAIIGATFAYFTATQSNNTAITGNAAAVTFDLAVTRAETTDQTNGGLIPMSNNMVEAAVSNASTKGVCVDANGNSVCQIYKITVTNGSTASMFLDGYVTLTGGLGTSADVTGATTTMRWAQVFRSGTEGNYTYSTGGTTTLKANTELTIASIDPAAGDKTDGSNIKNIYTGQTDDNSKQQNAIYSASTVTFGTSTDQIPALIGNYIRLSKHSTGNYTREGDLADALVFNQFLSSQSVGNNTADLFIVVWLTETVADQTPAAGNEAGFFNGTVVFNSGAGGEVSATFSGYTRQQAAGTP